MVLNKTDNSTTIISPFENKQRVLLHSCCAPCVCSIMETLKKSNIEYTVFFYNPNIDSKYEYQLRKKENIRYAKKINIPFIDADYDNLSWLKAIKGLEKEPERGKRCTVCFEFRLTKAAEFASKNNFRLFTSSLGISRWKDFKQVTECGASAASLFPSLKYWAYNWRKKSGSQRMEEISKEERFYKQNYCGCIFSKK